MCVDWKLFQAYLGIKQETEDFFTVYIDNDYVMFCSLVIPSYFPLHQS